MPFANSDQNRAYQRNWQRKKRSGGAKFSVEPSLEWRLENADSLKDVLEAAICELMAADTDPAVRGRVLASLVQTAIKLLEVHDLEARVAALEKRLLLKNYA